MLHLILEHFLLFSKWLAERRCSRSRLSIPLRWKTIDRSHFSRSYLKPLRGQLPNRSPSSCQRTISSIRTSLDSKAVTPPKLPCCLYASPYTQLEQQLTPRLSSCLTYQLRLIQSTTASFCPYCQAWAFLAMRTPGLNPTSLGARSTCHGKVSCLYLTASPLGCPKAR